MMRYRFAAIVILLILPAVSLRAQPARGERRTVHVFVALADNATQGIVPVPKKIGDGNDAENNLYWGCDEGLRSYFKKSADWKLVKSIKNPEPHILESCVFMHSESGAFLLADAYRGSEIKRAIEDFLQACAGRSRKRVPVSTGGTEMKIRFGGEASLVAYIGHDGLMDFHLAEYPRSAAANPREAIVLWCISEKYFAEALAASGARPLLMTTQLMYPGSFILKRALDGWIRHESDEEIRTRVGRAYAENQRISIKAALGVFSTGK